MPPIGEELPTFQLLQEFLLVGEIGRKSQKLKKATEKSPDGNWTAWRIGLIEEQVRATEIFNNTANIDHVPSAEVFRNALAAKKEPTIFIHT